jgi:hypothetical protein
MSEISEHGPWTADGDQVIAVSSGDFNHDVVLIVTGDFAERDDKLRYAQRLAELLTREFVFSETVK